ncbi:MAG: deoxyribodipyrimidine photo-lyase [Candidatus Bipolaricaulota bacterium]|nr:deoxyribodipyrimidine photo-lyase [Candidatus Bipolaricaulota bacterium]MDW8030679.1 deoxyribodipyrimidine photo-lyase [Candidatus Bipolaricaulota bacterium]
MTRIEPERIHRLNDRPLTRGQYVLYWMQASQRAFWNPALEFAVDLANEHKLPVLVCFGLTPNYPEANLRHYAWMLEGLRETAQALEERSIGFIIRLGNPPEVALSLAQKAAAIVTDRGYLRHQRAWRQYLAERAPCLVIEIEGDAIVPVETAYSRAAVSAAVLRRRLQPLIPRFLRPLHERAPQVKARFSEPTLDPTVPERLLALLDVDRTVGPVDFPSGTRAARARLHNFLQKHLPRYAELRSDPRYEVTSRLSPYLHFGQISPVEIAWEVARLNAPGASVFLEELIVRRELAINFVWYTPSYDRWEGLPRWAQETLHAHAADPRPALYSLEELEWARTDDPIWNAAQSALVRTGRLHNYLRMYWGKRLLVWTAHPKEALRIGLYLNNKYALDGRDPNSYTGVGWCLGLHDRPFPERPIFGKVRPMTPEGFQRKYGTEPELWKTT